MLALYHYFVTTSRTESFIFLKDQGSTTEYQGGLPDGLSKLLAWLQTLDEALDKPTSPLAGLAKLWKRLKEQVSGDPDGWAKLWKRLRSLDEDKIRDYKEDIDSLLILVWTAPVIAESH